MGRGELRGSGTGRRGLGGPSLTTHPTHRPTPAPPTPPPLLSDEKWGGAEYKKLATETSDALLKYAVNPTSHLPNLGDWVSSDPNAYQDRGAPGVGPRQYHYVSRPSDCMAWNMVILSKINSKWNQVKDACIEGIAQLSSMSDCGLVADFGVWDPSTKRLNPAPYDRPLLEKARARYESAEIRGRQVEEERVGGRRLACHPAAHTRPRPHPHPAFHSSGHRLGVLVERVPRAARFRVILGRARVS